MPRKLTLTQTIDRAQELLAEQRFEDDRQFLEDAIQRFPNDPELRLLYGTCLLDTRPDDAVEEIAQAIKLDVNNVERLTRAGGLLLALGYVDAAASYMSRAFDLRPDGFVLEADRLNLSGGVLAARGQDRMAEAAFRQAIDLEPGAESFSRDLARFLADRGRVREAVAAIDASLPRVSDDTGLVNLRQHLTG